MLLISPALNSFPDGGRTYSFELEVRQFLDLGSRDIWIWSNFSRDPYVFISIEKRVDGHNAELLESISCVATNIT